MSLTNIKLYYSKFFDEKGQFIKNQRFAPYSKVFSFKDKSYNVDLRDASYFDSKGILWTNRYFMYNLSNPDPLILNKKMEPIISPEIYNIMLETKTAQKLNDLSKPRFNLNFKTLIIIGVVIVAGYLLATGKLF